MSTTREKLTELHIFFITDHPPSHSFKYEFKIYFFFPDIFTWVISVPFFQYVQVHQEHLWYARGHLTAFKHPLRVKFLQATRLKINQLSILLESTTHTSLEVPRDTSRRSLGTGRCVNEAPSSQHKGEQLGSANQACDPCLWRFKMQVHKTCSPAALANCTDRQLLLLKSKSNCIHYLVTILTTAAKFKRLWVEGTSIHFLKFW